LPRQSEKTEQEGVEEKVGEMERGQRGEMLPAGGKQTMSSVNQKDERIIVAW